MEIKIDTNSTISKCPLKYGHLRKTFSLIAFGFILSLFLFVATCIALYCTNYIEDCQKDLEGDFVFLDLGVEADNDQCSARMFVGTWVILNPYFFVHNEETVKELENWRTSELKIHVDGTFELIRPPYLLAKMLLIPDCDWNAEEYRELLSSEKVLLRQSVKESIFGTWTKHVDYTQRRYFNFQAIGRTNSQKIQIVIINNDRIKNQLAANDGEYTFQHFDGLNQGQRLHWSTCSSINFPKEGIIWERKEQGE